MGYTSPMKTISEPHAKAKFLEKAPRLYFDVYKEVKGIPTYIKPIKRLYREWGNVKGKNEYKIDFILSPTYECLKLGWDLGPVGVEVKKYPLDGKEFGRAISQIMDYQSALFETPDGHNKELSMIFLYSSSHAKGYGGTEASIMMQEGIGLVRTYEDHDFFQLVHANGNYPIFNFSMCGDTYYNRPRFGYRTGSR